MLLPIPGVLNADELGECWRILNQAPWVDGKVTAGRQSAQVKRNQQLAEDSPAATALRAIVLPALGRNAAFNAAVLPLRIYPPLFNRYDVGESFGTHVDNAVRGRNPLRTDVSVTLFLTDPTAYDGGELVLEGTNGVQRVKLPAGDLLIYPSTSLHHVTAITRGSRVSSFFWVQSMIRDAAQRALLYDLDCTTASLAANLGDRPEVVTLTGIYHNLIRQWAEV